MRQLDDLLERTAIHHRASAATLRAHGREREAARLERFALRARLRLEAPKATQLMHAYARAVRDASSFGPRVEQALDGAVSLLGADFGNVQVRDPDTGVLTIVCHHGFESEFLEYFAVVDDDASACGRAATRRIQAVITDVDTDPAFAPHRQIAAASGFRAVQSTPLVDDRGHVVGIVSTHFRRPHRPSNRDLLIMQWYAELVGAAVARNGEGPSTWPGPQDDEGDPQVAAILEARRERGPIVYSYGADARARAGKAAALRRRSRRLLEDAAATQERVAELQDRAFALYGRLAESERRRGNGGRAREIDRVATANAERADALRARAVQAWRHAENDRRSPGDPQRLS